MRTFLLDSVQFTRYSSTKLQFHPHRIFNYPIYGFENLRFCLSDFFLAWFKLGIGTMPFCIFFIVLINELLWTFSPFWTTFRNEMVYNVKVSIQIKERSSNTNPIRAKESQMYYLLFRQIRTNDNKTLLTIRFNVLFYIFSFFSLSFCRFVILVWLV